MKPIIRLKSISEINRFVNLKLKHPLISVVDFSQADEYLEEGMRISADFYTLMLKNYCTNGLKYGRQAIDFDEGHLICIGPNQVLTLEKEAEKKAGQKGWGLFFHADILHGSNLAAKMGDYGFFAYDTTEALHLSSKEQETLYDCIQKIEAELNENIDAHSNRLICSNLELLLNYCMRYYGRQFITRQSSHSKIVEQIDEYLRHYFKSRVLAEKGLPTVKSLAEMVHLSASYLSDLLRRETGRNAQEHIHHYLIEEAKHILLSTDDSVGEVAHALGFEYPQYFSRLFKQKTGKSPIAYRNLS